jgi:hypothetical protein
MALWGIFIPQHIDMATLTQSYSPIISYLVAAFDLHRIEFSWVTHLLVILWFLHLIARAMGPLLSVATAPEALQSDLEALEVGPANANEDPAQWLARLVPKWRRQQVGGGRVRASTGYRREGLIFLAIALMAFALGTYLGHSSGTTATISLMTGPPTDTRVRSRYVGKQLVSGKWQPWKPPFTLACTEKASLPVSCWLEKCEDQYISCQEDEGCLGVFECRKKCKNAPECGEECYDETGEESVETFHDLMKCGQKKGCVGVRDCQITVDTNRYDVKLQPGVDILFEGMRLTHIGQRRVSGMSGFDAEFSAPGELTRSKAAVGRSFDVYYKSRLLSSVLMSGTDPQDPAILLAAAGADPKQLKALKLRIYPRTELLFKVTTSGHIWFVWGGIALFMVSLLLLVVLPGYTLEINYADEKHWRLSIVGEGLFACPQKLAKTRLGGRPL